MKQQKGFTLIELVVVIVILGVLAAVALPRFMNATEDAHTSAVKGTGGALAAGVALLHSQWELNRAKGDLNIDPDDNINNFGVGDVDVNTAGWPVATDDTNSTGDAADCAALWTALLQGSAPTVATSGTVDYVASYTAPDCKYSYSLDGSSPAQRTITYETDTGAVITDAQ
ncbi:type II secretion system protein G [compost metagenome]